jgi:hypothetical protein
MSVRPTSRNVAPAPAQVPIGFKSEFTGSPAAIQANHEEQMGKLLSRLDQLQAKVCSQGDVDAESGGGGRKMAISNNNSSVFKTKPLLGGSSSSSITATSYDHSDLIDRYIIS